MTLKENWSDGNIFRASDLNEITSTVNAVATISATSIKTENFSTTAGKLIPCDATAGAFTITLPEAPPDDARVVVKKIDSSANAVTVACSGSDRINKSGGPTTLTLDVANQVVTLQYDVQIAVWYIVSGDIPTSTLGKSLVNVADASAARTLINAVSDSDSRLTNTRTPTDGTVTSAKLDSTFLGTLVTKTGTETLTAKTLTNPKINNIYDTNGGVIVGLSTSASSTNYLSVSNTISGGTPGITVNSSVDNNVGLNLSPKGNGRVNIVATTGQTPTISADGADNTHNLNLRSKNGVVQINGVEAVTISGNQILTGKTISGSSNTFTNIPTSALVGEIASGAGATSSTDYEVVGTQGKVAAGTTTSIGATSLQSTFILPKLNNDLAFHFLRGGTISITKNGTTAVANTDYTTDTDTPFSPKSGWWSLKPSATSDTFTVEITHPYVSFNSSVVYGIDMRAYQAAKNVTIEVWNTATSAWVTVGSVTDNTSGFYAKTFTAISTYTKIRYTLTNFASSTVCYVSSFFVVSPSIGNGPGEYYVARNGGSLYGTSSAPATLTAAGGDANVSLNLVSKGTGTVRVNNAEVVTTTGIQNLSGKTISGYVPLTSGKIDTSYLPTSSYSTSIGNGSDTSFVVTHNLGTTDVIIGVWETATGTEVNCDKVRSSTSTVTLTFATAPSLNAYRVTVLSNGGAGQAGGTITQYPWGVTTLTAATTLSSVSGTTYIILLNSSTANPTLPNAIGNSSRYIIKNIWTSDRTIFTSASQTIEGQSSLVLSTGASVELISDGSNWRII